MTDLAREPLLPSGTIVAGATIERQVATGSTAVVYSGRTSEGTRVAIKVALISASERSAHRFHNEARLSSAVRHPNIVQALSVGELEGPPPFNGCMFVVFPFVEGFPLSSERLHYYRGMPEARARPLARQLASAMRALHAEGIVHRDIKPANIIRDEDNRVHLVDFGIAYATGTSRTPKTEDVTLRGIAVGSTFYMSPQQFQHAPVTPSFDVFSYGATLFEWLTGTPPEYRTPEDEVAKRRRMPSWSPPDFPATDPPVTPELVDLTLRCLAHDPASRPTAEDICAFFDTTPDSSSDESETQVARELPSAPTMPLKRPSVIADEARPAGDVTMTGLARRHVAMPSVYRIQALAEDLDAVTDEESEVSANEFRAALAIAEENLPPPEHTETDASAPDKTGAGEVKARPSIPTSAPRPSPAAPLPVSEPDTNAAIRNKVALVLGLALFSFALTAWWVSSARPSALLRSALTASVSLPSPPQPHTPAPPPELSPAPAPPPDLSPEPSPPSPSTAETPARPKNKLKRRGQGSKKTQPSKPEVLPDHSSAPKSKAPAASSEARSCKETRDAATRAFAAGQPTEALRRTKGHVCWKGHEKTRQNIRVAALYALQKYAACVREGRGSTSPETTKYTKLCESRK